MPEKRKKRSDDMNKNEEVVGLLLEKGLYVTAAESCTGGLFASMITEVSGSSGCFCGSAVTYSNSEKNHLLGVEKSTLENFGAVSYNTAIEMADGARILFGADIGIGITGIAGPTGGSTEKPVGLVYISLSRQGGTVVYKKIFKGTRKEVREAAASFALSLVFDAAKEF